MRNSDDTSHKNGFNVPHIAIKTMRREYGTPISTTQKNKISDYTEISTIGRYAFGSVVEARLSHGELALETARYATKRIALVLIERSRMLQCAHPNIVRLIEMFADGRCLVLLEKWRDLNVFLKSLCEPLSPNLTNVCV